MELFAKKKMIYGIQALTIFAKRFILGVSQGNGFHRVRASDKTNENPTALKLI